MQDVKAHYERHLAPVYAWSAGGAEDAIADGGRWLASLPLPAGPAHVVDLGAGFGATAIPLARAGHRVTAVDTSAALLAELLSHAGGANVAVHEAELVQWLQGSRSSADVVLCVGDTLPHLASHEQVDALLAGVAQVLAPDGLAVLAYRPRRDLAPDERFVLVRADEQRTLTAFLEVVDDAHQIVWDILHERVDGRTTQRVSGYRKLRLDPSWIVERASAHGLVVEAHAPYRGMVVQLLRRAS